MRLGRIISEPRPLLRAGLEFVNAANGLRPLARKGYSTVLVFWFGWPTSEVPGLYFSASLADALRRGRRGDFAGRRGKAALALTAASWAILAVIRYRGVTTPGPVLEAGLRQQLGPDYAEALRVLPQSEPKRRGRRNLPLRTTVARRRYVEKTNVVSYGPHGRANLADIWRRRDLPRDGKAPVLVQIPGGAWMIGMRRPAGVSPDEPPGRPRLGVRVGGLPRLPGAHLARPHRRRQTGAGVGQGQHRTLRRGPRLRRDHRRVRRRPPVRPGGTHPE